MSTLSNVFKSIGKHKSAISAGVAVVGVFVTSYLSGKAAVEVDHLIDPDMDRKLKAKVYAKAYWKTAVSALVTSGCIIGCHKSHVRTELGLAAALAVNKDKFLELRDKAKEKFGEEAMNDIYREMAEEDVREFAVVTEDGEIVDSILNIPDQEKEKTLYLYEPFTEQTIPTTYVRILEAHLESNFRLQKDYSVEFNVLLEHLGGECTSDSSCLIWDFGDESQNYASSCAEEGFVVSFSKKTWDEIARWMKSDRQMTPDDAIHVTYALPPGEKMPWD